MTSALLNIVLALSILNTCAMAYVLVRLAIIERSDGIQGVGLELAERARLDRLQDHLADICKRFLKDTDHAA